jgi:hypothetical protein
MKIKEVFKMSKERYLNETDRFLNYHKKWVSLPVKV